MKFNKKKKLVYLGGTVGKNPWRKAVIDELTKREIDISQLVGPTVNDNVGMASFDTKYRLSTVDIKKNATHIFYYLGNPMLETGILSATWIAEAIMDLYDNGKRTSIVIDTNGINSNITGFPLQQMEFIQKLITERFPKANLLPTLLDAIDWLDVELRDRSKSG